ncbi:hypothetical protein FALBO_16309 [Fusarium albosuccineum]|uniref:Uncharacterized protein n=1 Tax=Fusarium albosuccineum TaxID=1237068 RepID=A0A8H4KJM7_9HYPO|nr:hypothetical protein FALBO_16309 [Fusarium albosuccineum]
MSSPGKPSRISSLLLSLTLAERSAPIDIPRPKPKDDTPVIGGYTSEGGAFFPKPALDDAKKQAVDKIGKGGESGYEADDEKKKKQKTKDNKYSENKEDGGVRI